MLSGSLFQQEAAIILAKHHSLQRHQTPLAKSVILLHRTQELLIDRRLNRLVCLCYCVILYLRVAAIHVLVQSRLAGKVIPVKRGTVVYLDKKHYNIYISQSISVIWFYDQGSAWSKLAKKKCFFLLHVGHEPLNMTH